MKLVSVQIENFCTYKDTFINFTRFKDNKVLILGTNLDEEGLDSNGVGKSNIFNALAWVISGQTSKRSKIGVDDVIGSFSDTTKVTLILEGRFNLKIERTRSSNDKSLKFWINNQAKYGNDTYTNVQDNLLLYLGVPKEFHKSWFEDFMNMTYFSKDVAKVFTSIESTPSEKFEFISRFLNLRTLDLCKKNAETKLGKIDGEIKDQQIKISIIESRLAGISPKEVLLQEIEAFEEKIKSKQQEIEKLNKVLEIIQEKDRLENEVSQKKSLIENKQREMNRRLDELKSMYDKKLKEYQSLENIDSELKKIKQQLINFKIEELFSKIEELQLSSKEDKTKLDKEVFKLNEIQQNIRNIQRQKEEALTCPSCNAKLMLHNHQLETLDINVINSTLQTLEECKIEIESIIIDSNKEYQAILDSIKTNQENINQYNISKKQLELLEFKSNTKDKLIDEINQIVEQKENWEKTSQEYVESLNNELLTLQSKLITIGTTISLQQYNDYIKDLNNSITSLSSTIEKNKFILSKIEEDLIEKALIEKELIKLKDQGAGLKFAIEGFPTIKKWRIDGFIPTFKLETNAVISRLKSKIKIKIDTEGLTKKGTIVDSFPISGIDANGKERGLETFSEGERARISLSISWALKTLVENQNYLPFKFTLMDEIADGLDESGIKYLSTLMDQTDGQFFVISHFNTFKDYFSDKINITKENGISTIN